MKRRDSEVLKGRSGASEIRFSRFLLETGGLTKLLNSCYYDRLNLNNWHILIVTGRKGEYIQSRIG